MTLKSMALGLLTQLLDLKATVEIKIKASNRVNTFYNEASNDFIP